jgi:HK97 family phage prohead protease
LEHKRFAEFKLLEGDTGGFEGYASLFGVRDDGGDVVEAGAFKDALASFLADGFIALGHDWEQLAIGTIADAKEDARGLLIRAEYHSTPEAQAARKVAQERMARGKSVGLSIGYEIKPGGAEFAQDGSRHLMKLGLFEVSQVNVPMLRPAGLTSVKGFGVPFDDHSDSLRDAVSEWLERLRAGTAKNVKEGRAISSARRERMSGVRDALLSGADEIGQLLQETAPPETADARSLYFDFQRILAAQTTAARGV